MYKLVISASALGTLLHAAGNHKVAELVQLPHPMKVLASDKMLEKLKVSDGQQKRLENEIVAVFPVKMHASFDAAYDIEQRIKKAVMHERKTTRDLGDEIGALIEIKRTMTQDHIDALNALQEILTKEQFSQLMEAVRAKKKCAQQERLHHKEHGHDHHPRHSCRHGGDGH